MNKQKSQFGYRPSPFNEVGHITPLGNSDMSNISPFRYEKPLRMGESTRLSICKNDKGVYIYNPGNIDLEMLYERKSKSVMKKRDEIQK